MKCPKCDTVIETKEFLGWPVKMWYEISEFLAARGAPEESPLKILSRLEEKK